MGANNRPERDGIRIRNGISSFTLCSLSASNSRVASRSGGTRKLPT